MNKKLTETEKDAKKLKEVNRELEIAKSDLERREEELNVTINELNVKLVQANQNLAASAMNPESPNVSVIDPELLAEMRDELEILRDQNKRIKEENSQMKADFEEVDFTTQELRMKVSELTRYLEDKDEELASYRESAMQANEELKNKMDFENDIPELDVAPKGNSLFSEVEDRRHIAEEKLKRAETKLEKYKVNAKSRNCRIAKIKESFVF